MTAYIARVRGTICELKMKNNYQVQNKQVCEPYLQL